MAKQEKSITKILKPLSRGRITIPLEFRQKLKIDENTILFLALKGNKIEITPITACDNSEKDSRYYSDEEIAEFLNEDKIDQKTADIVRELLTEEKI